MGGNINVNNDRSSQNAPVSNSGKSEKVSSGFLKFLNRFNVISWLRKAISPRENAAARNKTDQGTDANRSQKPSSASSSTSGSSKGVVESKSQRTNVDAQGKPKPDAGRTSTTKTTNCNMSKADRKKIQENLRGKTENANRSQKSPSASSSKSGSSKVEVGSKSPNTKNTGSASTELRKPETNLQEALKGRKQTVGMSEVKDTEKKIPLKNRENRRELKKQERKLDSDQANEVMKGVSADMPSRLLKKTFPKAENIIGKIVNAYQKHGESSREFLSALKGPNFKKCYNPPDDGNCGVSAVMYYLLLAAKDKGDTGAKVRANIENHFPEPKSAVRKLMEKSPEEFGRIMAEKGDLYKEAITDFRLTVGGLLMDHKTDDNFSGMDENTRGGDAKAFKEEPLEKGFKGKWINAAAIDNVGRLFGVRVPIYESKTMDPDKNFGNPFYGRSPDPAFVMKNGKKTTNEEGGAHPPNSDKSVDGAAIILNGNHFMVLIGGKQDVIDM